MKRIIAAITLLVAGSVHAQVGAPQKMVVAIAISNLPPASNAKDEFWTVYDGFTSGDCSIGGGDNTVICVSNGFTWTAVGGAAGGNGFPGRLGSTAFPANFNISTVDGLTLNTPTLTGTATAPTNSCGSNNDIATQAYVANCSTSAPSAGPNGAVQTSDGAGAFLGDGNFTKDSSGNVAAAGTITAGGSTSAVNNSMLEVTPSTPGTSGATNLWADAGTHRFKFNPNAAGSFFVPGVATAGTSGHLAEFASNGIDLVDGGAPPAAGVTSVGFTGGLISVANPTTTPAFTVAGTSGGIPYFSGVATWASSAAFPSGDFVLGGGAGSAPTASFSVVPVANGGTATGTAPTDAQLLIGQSGGTYLPKTASGSCTVSDTGVFTCSGGGVTSLTGDGTLFNNAASTGAVTLTPATFAAHKFYANNTASTSTPAAVSIGISDTTPNSYAADTGSVNASIVTLAPAATAYATNLTFSFLPAFTNTVTNPTVNLNSLGAKTITRAGGNPINIGDLSTTNIVTVKYNGTSFDIENEGECGVGNIPCTNTANFFSGGTQEITAASYTTVAAKDQGTAILATPAYIQKTVSSGSPAAFGTNLVSGSGIIVILSCNFFSGTPVVTDTLGNTYTLATSINAAPSDDYIFTASNSPSGADSVSWTSVPSCTANIYEYSSVRAFDVTVQTPFTSVFNASSGSLTTTSGDLLFSLITQSNSQGSGFTVPGYTLRETNGGNGAALYSTADSTESVPGSYSANWSWTNQAMSGTVVLLAMKSGASQIQTADLRQFLDYNNNVLGAINAYGNLATDTAGNTDQAGIIAVSGTTATYTFKNPNYTIHPVCSGSPESDPGVTVRWWISYTSTTSFTVNFSASYTGNFDYTCIPRN